MEAGLAVSCERTRAWVSAEVDGVLSDFESALLRAHVRGCEACRIFREDVQVFTDTLRMAPLEKHDLHVVIPPRRRRLVQPVRVAAAALAVAAVGLGSTFATLDARGVFSATSSRSSSALDTGLFRELQVQKRQLWAKELHRRATMRRHPGPQPM